MADTEKFHLSLYVTEVARSAQFYESLFGVKPTKIFADYAKFELANPPVVLSLEQKTKDDKPPRLSHLGVKLFSRSHLIEWASKIAERGVKFEHIDQVACCYANQSKIYTHDPDGHLVEVYMVNEDLPGPEAQVALREAQHPAGEPNAVYEHHLPQGFPTSLGPDSQFEKVALRGTLNADLPDSECFRILQESFRALKPGGTVMTHMLVGDKELGFPVPPLPEPATHVKKIPTEPFIWTAFREAGFIGLKADRLSAHHVFEFGGVKFRELLLSATKPESHTPASRTVVYKGPFPSVEVESGQRFVRGERVVVDAASWNQISTGVYQDAFVAVNAEGGCQ